MNINPKVEDFIEAKAHPLTDEIQRVREIILTADSRIEEDVKWSSPTFMYKGNMASYNMNARKFVSLLFHKGAMIKDKNGLLSGDGKEARVARFNDMDDIEAKRTALQDVVREWVRIRNEIS